MIISGAVAQECIGTLGQAGSFSRKEVTFKPNKETEEGNEAEDILGRGNNKAIKVWRNTRL